MNLKQFIGNTELRNVWLKEPNIDIYVRRSNRFIEGKMILCLDVATVTVSENKRGKGIFSKFLKKFEKEAKKLNRFVFVESILNERLKTFLLKKDYKSCSVDGKNLYKSFNE